MSEYIIEIALLHAPQTSHKFAIVDQSVRHNGGTIINNGTLITIRMDGSGTAGGLHFINSVGEQFILIAGVHNYGLWLDIVPDVHDDDTAEAFLPTYYAGGIRSKINLVQEVHKRTSKGTAINFKLEGTSQNEHKYSTSLLIGNLG